MSYESLVPGDRGRTLRAALLEAITRVYEANVERFDPEGIGDDATWFGLSISRNLWHLIEIAVADIDGVKARRASNTFFVEIDGLYELYLCKAPPDASSIEGVSFDSHVRSRIIQRNGSHLQMRLDLAGETTAVVSDLARAHYAVIVHFGDPENGFANAVIGAPYLLPSGEFGWEWDEPFGDHVSGARALRQDSSTESRPDATEFGLVLRDVSAVSNASDHV
jgi:hypothetical protein